jgi:uncharacterized membrane protein YfcA
MGLIEVALLFVAGIVTGMVNTIAGSGTIFALGAMVFLGIPIEIANTTNRLGVLFQNIAGSLSYRRYESLSHLRLPYVAAAATFVGALGGAYFAANVSSGTFELLALVVILALIVQSVLDMRGKKLTFSLRFSSKSTLAEVAVFFLIGLYGGFIQIGVGILLLLGIRAFFQLSWNASNYFKLLIVLIYTVPTTIYFAMVGMIEWQAGIFLALGQIIGAYGAARLFSLNEKLKAYIPYFVLGMLILTALRILLF